jgi:hypothetical protein
VDALRHTDRTPVYLPDEGDTIVLQPNERLSHTEGIPMVVRQSEVGEIDRFRIFTSKRVSVLVCPDVEKYKRQRAARDQALRDRVTGKPYKAPSEPGLWTR